MVFWWGGGMGGHFLSLRWAYIANIIVLFGLDPFQKFDVGRLWVVVRKWRWWSKGILEFRIGPNLGFGT